MTTSSPDGSWTGTDPGEAAARLQAASPGWVVWWGRATGEFWAMSDGSPLIEARTPDELAQRMQWARQVLRQ